MRESLPHVIRDQGEEENFQRLSPAPLHVLTLARDLFRLTIARILDQPQKELFSSLNGTITGNEKREWQLLASEVYESNWGVGTHFSDSEAVIILKSVRI